MFRFREFYRRDFFLLRGFCRNLGFGCTIRNSISSGKRTRWMPMASHEVGHKRSFALATLTARGFRRTCCMSRDMPTEPDNATVIRLRLLLMPSKALMRLVEEWSLGPARCSWIRSDPVTSALSASQGRTLQRLLKTTLFPHTRNGPILAVPYDSTPRQHF